MRTLDQITDEMVRLIATLPELDNATSAAVAEQDAAWKEIADNHDRVDEAPDEMLQRAQTADELVAACRGNSNKTNATIAQLERSISRLNDPAEQQRRRESSARLSSLKGDRQMSDNSSIHQDYLSESGRFKPGLDARYKSDLVKSALGISDGENLHTYEPEDAVARLEARSWLPFLEKKKAALAAQAARDEAKAERVAASADEAPKKATRAPRAAKAEGTEVTPDPKPERKPRTGRKVGG